MHIKVELLSTSDYEIAKSLKAILVIYLFGDIIIDQICPKVWMLCLQVLKILNKFITSVKKFN